MIYPNDLCPYCKEPLATDADQVTCPDCGAVLHRQCWLDNEGCTTFGCNGRLELLPPAPARPLAAPGAVRCPQCGTLSHPATVQCPICGRRLQAGYPARDCYPGSQ